MYFSDFLKEHTHERGLQVIDKLIAIVQGLYTVNVDLETTSDKAQYLTSLNESTVNNLKQLVLRNWSDASENLGEIGDNITNEETDNGYSMKVWLRLTWDILFFIIIFVAIVGNLLVLWIVAGKPNFLYQRF